MDYLSVYTSFDEYRSGVEQYGSDESKTLIGFADYRTATFGHRVVPKSALDLGAVDHGLPTKERMAALVDRGSRMEAVLASSPSIVFFPFSKPLSGSLELLASLEDLVAKDDPSLVPFRTKDGMPAVADYSKSDSGVSTVYSVSPDTLRKAPPRLVGSTASRWPDRAWWVALGILQPPRPPKGSQSLIEQASSRFGQ